MARDYKSYSSKKSKKRKSKENNKRSLLWFVVIALIIVFGFSLYWLVDQNASKQSKPVEIKKVIKKKVEKLKQQTQKIKFDFYNMLPNQDVTVQQKQPQPVSNDTTSESTYIVQVASLRNSEDADAFKAKLALNGFNVDVKKTVNSSGNTWYRVQIGPYDNFDDAFDAQNNLRKDNFDGIIKKVNN